MDKFNKIFKNVIVFLAVFLTLNYVLQSCQNKEESLPQTDGNLLLITTDNEYSKRQIVKLNITNNTVEEITIPNECPNEPFNIFRYENNEWVKKESSPKLECENAKETILKPGEEVIIGYENWNNSLFSEMGRFKIEFETELKEKEITITSNEFIIVKEGILRQLWDGVFYKPIYNGLIFLTKVIPGHYLGLAIIILTLIIRTILLIPSHKAMVSQKRLQEIQPRLEKIKQKYKGDQQRIAMETMAVWKDGKINPLGSCLPILLQFPFLIALFYVIKSGLNPDNAFLLYTEYSNFTFNDINVNFLGLNLTKINIYILPLLIGSLQFIQIKLSTANKMKKKDKEKGEKGEKKQNEMAIATNMMTYIMPVMIAVFTASLPAGVGIYWGTSTSYGIIQQLFVNKSKSPKEATVKVISN